MNELSGIRIAAIACNIPKNRVDNLEMPGFDLEKLEKIVKGTGVRHRHLAEASKECTSDFCFSAAKRIIEEMHIDVNEIGAIILVTQSSDYILPATSCILQTRLGLPQDTIAFDVNLGCSGYVYGLYIVGSIMPSSGKRYALLLAGDTSSEHISQTDQSAMFLFGDAGSATLLERVDNAPPLAFSLGTEGSGANSLIIKSGSSRNPITAEGLEPKVGIDGNARADNQLFMDGMEIFNFAISTVVDQIKSFADPIESYDAVVFHQANFFMLDTMRKMLKIPEDKFLYSLDHYGNTSSASIPMTICHHAANQDLHVKYLICGFGVGLSWGIANIRLDGSKIFSIAEGIYDSKSSE